MSELHYISTSFCFFFFFIKWSVGLDEKDPADSAGAAVISPTVAPPTIPKVGLDHVPHYFPLSYKARPNFFVCVSAAAGKFSFWSASNNPIERERERELLIVRADALLPTSLTCPLRKASSPFVCSA